jgi:hypothetical protein
MLVEETQVFTPREGGTTVAAVSATIRSNSAFKTVIERFGFWKGRENIIKSSKGLKHVISSMRAMRASKMVV